MNWNRAESRALLIGNSVYNHLPPVPAARHSLARMRSVLTSDLCGWPSSSIRTICERQSLGDLPDELARYFADAKDVALFYYVGHGQVAPGENLCLCLEESLVEERQKTTSLTFEQVREALSESPAQTKIVILDCCYAGFASQERLPLRHAQSLSRMLRSAGTYTLAAVGGIGKATFEDEDSSAEPQTHFTRYFLDVIERGIPYAGPDLSLRQVFGEAAFSLSVDGKPQPTSNAAEWAPEFIFARNASPKARTHRPDEPGLAVVNAGLFPGAVSFSPDGNYLATGARRWLRLWRSQSAEKVHEQRIGGIFTLVGGLAFDLDGRSLAAASSDKTVRVWDITIVEAAQLRTSISVPTDAMAVAIRSDGQIIASGHDGSVAWLQFSGNDGRSEIREIQHSSPVSCVALSSDGLLLATGCENGALQLWRAGDTRRIAGISHTYDVQAIKFSPDGRLLATGGLSLADLGWITRTFRLPELSEGLLYFSHGPTTVRPMAFSGDGRLLATGEVEGDVWVWDVRDGRQVHRTHHRRGISAIAIDPLGTRLAVSTDWDTTVRISRIPPSVI